MFQRGYTPLMIAAGHGHLSVLALLLERGADIHAQNDVNEQLGIINIRLHLVHHACVQEMWHALYSAFGRPPASMEIIATLLKYGGDLLATNQV